MKQIIIEVRTDDGEVLIEETITIEAVTDFTVSVGNEDTE